MSQINEGTNCEQKIAKYKAFIMELSEVQESYYQKLLKEIKINPKAEEYLFDYIYDDSFSNFYDYLVQFPQGKELDESGTIYKS
jgi:hypothetical protein